MTKTKTELAPSQRLVKLNENPMAMLAQAARDPAVDAAKVRELRAIQKEIQDDLNKQEYARDFNRMIPKLPKVNKDGMIVIAPKPGKSGQKTRFYTLDNVMEVLWPILAECHFGFQWAAEVIPDHGALTHVCRAYLTHDNGAYRESAWPIYPETTGSKNDAQARGSGASYAKRYTLRDLVPFISFAKEDRDDDGAAVAPAEPEKPEPRISPVQEKQLRKEIKENHVPPEVFKEKFCDGGDVANVPASRYDAAIVAIRNFGKRWNEAQKAKGSNEAA